MCLTTSELWSLSALAYKFVFEWQTLIAALIALAAAWATIRMMRLQMDAETGRHQEAQRRRRLSARAKIPDALSELSAYVRASTARLVGSVDATPPEPTAAIAVLKEIVEFVDDNAATRTFELVSGYQVFRARCTREASVRVALERDDRLYDAVLLQAYVNSLFAYGRNETDEVASGKPTLEEMTLALKNAASLIHMVQNEELYGGVKSLIARRHRS